VLTRSRGLRSSTGWLLLPTCTYLRLRSVRILPSLAFGAQRGVLSPIACTVRVIAELLPGTTPFGQRLTAKNTFHRAHRTANGIACASLQRKRKGGVAVVPFAFTEAERSRSSQPPLERSSERISGCARTDNHVLPTSPWPAHHQLVVNAVINMVINQSLKESSISQQPAVNQSSNSHQSDVKSSTFSSRS